MHLPMRTWLVLAGSLLFVGPGAMRLDEPESVAATSKDPAVAVRQEKVVHGVLWGMSYDEATEKARTKGKPILIYFGSIQDTNSRTMELTVLPQAEIKPLLARFVTVRLDIDFVPIGSITRDQREALAEPNLELQHKMTGKLTTPQFVALDAKGKVLSSTDGFLRSPKFKEFLEGALAEAGANGK